MANRVTFYLQSKTATHDEPDNNSASLPYFYSLTPLFDLATYLDIDTKNIEELDETITQRDTTVLEYEEIDRYLKFFEEVVTKFSQITHADGSLNIDNEHVKSHFFNNSSYVIDEKNQLFFNHERQSVGLYIEAVENIIKLLEKAKNNPDISIERD